MSALLISTHLYEKRPLKKPKLGPPDVYPQDPKQKEDELTAINVKQGYSSGTVVQDEYGTARNANITSNRFGEYFSAILSKKHELNTFSDTSRKKQQINKDSTLYVTSKTKNAVDSWFKDLASNSKSLAHLSRKVPVFNKKEEIFTTLYEFNVPMLKAEWFLKMSSAHQMAISESNNKSKKRQMPDPSNEWTACLCKFLKEHYFKMVESNNSSLNNNSLSTLQNTVHSQQFNIDELLKQWNYYTQLAHYLYECGLLDRHDFLSWLLELFEKIKSIEDLMLNLLVPLLIQYVDEFTQSEFLSRKLAYNCSRKVYQLVIEYNVELHSQFDLDKENISNGSTGNISTSNSCANNSNEKSNNTTANKSVVNDSSNNSATNSLYNSNTLSTCFKEIISCEKHRNILFGLSTIIQIITLDCPTALVWLNYIPSNNDLNNTSSKHPIGLHGSPLDYLPCEPSNLPMPPSENNERMRSQLRNAENLIRFRSSMSENKWFFKAFNYVNSSKSVGTVVNRLLNVLDCLDKHSFDRVSSSNSLDTLYNKIFSSYSVQKEQATSHLVNTQSSLENGSNDQQTSDVKKNYLTDIIEDDVPTVKLLCEWAVSTKRLGEFRSRIVAKLLERRQNEITSEKELHNETSDDKLKMEIDDVTTNETKTSPNLNNVHQKNANNDSNNIPIYQNILFDFLDLYAPVYEDKNSGLFSNSFSTASPSTASENKQAFNNLILLFSELIRHEVFSHDAYMCTLISRGQFSNPPNTALVISSSSNQTSKNNNEDSLSGLVPPLSNIDTVSNGGLMGSTINKSTSSSSLPMFDPLSNNSTLNSNEPSSNNWLTMSNDNCDEDNLDEDLDKILQHIKAGQQSLHDQTDILLPDAMESDKEDEAHGNNVSNNNNVTNPTSLSDLPGVSKTSNHSDQVNSASRHLLYTLHFPLPQDECFIHESNQRHILLYGVGKSKDEARHSVKKVTKEIQKLFSRKSSMDISDGGKVKKHVIKEGFNFENAIAKFQNLSIFDQQVVTNSCAATVLEMLNGVVIGNANHLPLIESIAFLFDLMEIALNVYGLIEFIGHMLKELAEVEIQLQQKCSMLARPYCTSIGLYIVGVLNRYHNYVIASNEDVVAVFDGLWKLVRLVNTPNDCSSAERCIFFYIYDLYLSCSLLVKKYHDIFSPILPKIKAMTNSQIESSSKFVVTSSIMMEYLKNPKVKLDSSHIRQLNENSSDRYALVFNAICCIAEANDMDYLNELSVLCAELTASCSLLSSEWFSAFKTLCNSTKDTNDYSSLLSQVNIGDRTIYDNLAVFTSILIARRCFGLEDFIMNVCVPSLLIPIYDSTEEAERSARLSCHLMLYLFKYYDSPLAASNSSINSSFASSSRYSLTSPGPLGLNTVTPPVTGGPKSPFVIKYACDRYLLGGALNSLRIELIVTVLKAIFVLGNQLEKRNSEKPDLNFDSLLKPNTSEESFCDLALLSQMSSKPKIDSIDKPSLADFSKHVLRQICLQDWVHDRCLREFMASPEILIKLMLDKRFSHKDAQYLLNMICYHKQMLPPSAHINDKSDSKQINMIFQNLDEWSLRISWLQLSLIYEQIADTSKSHSSSEVNVWMDTVARSIVEYFQQFSQNEPILDYKSLTLFTSKSTTNKQNSLSFVNNNHSQQNERIWLVAPLISKLPSKLQSKILSITASIFDSSSWIIYSQSQSGSLNSKSKAGFQGSKNTNGLHPSGITLNTQNPTSVLLSYPPFLSLLLMCLNSKEDHKDSILNSIYIQISQCINEKLSEEIRVKNSIQEGLQLRFSLVGAMFELIYSSNSLTIEWAILLLQLISFTIVDPHINYENFSTVIDMLASIMHTTYISCHYPELSEENKKQYQNLIKKLKKELNVERVGLGVRMAKQLLPIIKLQTEVIACEPMGSLVDTKGNKIAGFDSIDKKQGLQVAEKQKLSPWDLIEGHKNPAPISWTWFGGIRIERKPLRLEENFYLLARHNHNIRKPTSYYIEPPPLPPEDEPAPPPPPIISQTPMSTLPYSNSVLSQSNGPALSLQNSPSLNNLPAQPSSSFSNSPNLMHSLQQPQQSHNLPNNFHANPVQHLPNNLPHAMPHGPTASGQIHNSNMQAPTQPAHLMPNATTSDHQTHPITQTPHHMMINSHLNNNSSIIPPISNMPMDNMMDTLPPTNAGPVHSVPIQSLNPMRPPMTVGPPQPMNPVAPVSTRAPAPKKAKVPRRRRAPKNQAVNGAAPTVSGQQTPPIRMQNTFDTYNQAAGNNPMPQQTPVQGSNAWAYQQQVPNQQPNQNIPGQPVNPAGQTFFQSTGPQQSSGQGMIPQQTQQTRFNDHSIQNASKVRLRTMLNNRHPNSSQFNMPPNASGNTGPGSAMNNTGMINSQQNSNIIPSGVYQSEQQHMQQMMQLRTQMRPQRPQSNQSMATISNQNTMFQQQSINQSASGPMHHHIQQQQQSSNFGGPQSIPFNNNMQNMDSTPMQQIPSNASGYQPQGQPQANLMMRPQMQIASQQMTQSSNQTQFMQQRSQYTNVNMGQAQMNHSYGQQQQQQMMSGGQHWSQSNQMNVGPRVPMTQLQRQLSSNQGGQNQTQGSHPSYHPY